MLVVKNGVDPITEILHVTDDEIEHHIHNKERWVGNGATEDSLTPYTLTSGNGVFGTETLILDTGDTPIQSGKRFFDFNKMEVISVSSATVYVIRIIYGTGTVAAAESAGQYTTLTMIATGIGANISGFPIEIRMPRLAVGNKVWVKIKNATNLATITALFGLHEYDD